MNKKERFAAFVDHFADSSPEPETELNYRTPFELLVAVVLSAQCTDKRVNIVTGKLFEIYPDAESMSKSDFDTLFPLIRSISYPNNKTKHLLGLSKMLVEEYDHEIPATIEELQRLPGVGRKTANVIVSVLHHQPAMAVDTHVFRVSKRLGLATLSAKTPLAVEKQLVRRLPDEVIHKAHHWLILHGRYICLARKPKCAACEITSFCRYYEKAAI
ncbi:MAG: endonuclease-3 [Cyclobacteriaceae bacterium]|jgi:endonuclease-3